MNAYCPQCGTTVEATADRCTECKARYDIPGGWKPVASRNFESLPEAIGKVLVRAIVSPFISAIGLVIALAPAVPYGGSVPLLAPVAILISFLAGWTFLPMVRASKVAGAIVGTVWVLLAAYIVLAGHREFFIVAWSLATAGLGVCLYVTPPHWALASTPDCD